MAIRSDAWALRVGGMCAALALGQGVLAQDGAGLRQGGTYSNTGASTCAAATVVPVPVGPNGSPNTVTILGDNTPATGPNGCGGPLGFGPVWWEAFEITSKAAVIIDLCGTDPVQDPSYTILFQTCPSVVCPTPIAAFDSGRGQPYCADNNIWMYFSLAAGVYHLPVRSNVAKGPYQIHIHAETPPPLRPGPDLVTGSIDEVLQLGRQGTIGEGIVGLGVETMMCNFGDEAIPIVELPGTNHQVITANLFRLRTVAGSQRFEQIGRSWVKHTFGSNNYDECGLGCVPGPGNELTPACSDAYAAQQFSPCDMGPRSIVNPYTGVMPGGPDAGTGGGCFQNFPASYHMAHNHAAYPDPGIDHRLQVRDEDLLPSLNPGARYFAEAGYITTREFLHANGNQNNNFSHREYSVAGPGTNGVFTLTPLGETIQESLALDAWPGASHATIEPFPQQDGRAYVAWQVTSLGSGSWHYEYLVYNMNMNASIWHFEVPLPEGIVISNVEFSAPLAHAPTPDDGGYSSAPWAASITEDSIIWATDDFATDPLANAIRWGTGYNFRFDANGPPGTVDATLGLFKTGGSEQVMLLGPAGPIPAASAWGLAITALLLANAAGILLRRGSSL